MRNEATNRNLLIGQALGALILIVVGLAVGYALLAKPDAEAPPPKEDVLAAPGITSVAVDAKDNIYVGGDFGVQVFGPDGKKLREWKTAVPVAALVFDAGGNVYVATQKKVEKFDADGKSLLRWGKGGCETEDFGLLTGIAASDGNVFVADAEERVVYRFREDGRFLNYVGSKEQDPEGIGIVLPSPFLDCAAKDGIVVLNNSGRKRVEVYDFAGKRLKVWGKIGPDGDDFPGCCNPTNLAIAAKGRVVTADKGLPLVKVFDADGSLLKTFGRDVFAEECKGIDLAVDSRGRIYAVDHAAGCVRVFENANE
ncbi:MAG: NHL repeat-containing protein [Planctomycetota bacterium]